MKVCPQCHSVYTDPSLNFCLTDGAVLVVAPAVEGPLETGPGEPWQTADTIADARFAVPEARLTTSNPVASPTVEIPGMKAPANGGSGSTGRKVALLLSALAVLVVGGIAAWSFLRPASLTQNLVPNAAPSSRPNVTVQLPPEQDAAIRRELTDFLKNWARTNSEKNADAHLAHYANTLFVYYNESNRDRGHVLADRQRAYQRYDSIQMSVDNIKVTPESADAALIVFDKSWTMKNDKKTSTGSVEQEIHVTRTDGRWLIDSERDLRVYFLNNRENAASENTNQ